jgi:hypothetical protein
MLYINDRETLPKFYPTAILKIPNLLIGGRAKQDPLWPLPYLHLFYLHDILHVRNIDDKLVVNNYKTKHV